MIDHTGLDKNIDEGDGWGGLASSNLLTNTWEGAPIHTRVIWYCSANLMLRESEDNESISPFGAAFLYSVGMSFGRPRPKRSNGAM